VCVCISDQPGSVGLILCQCYKFLATKFNLSGIKQSNCQGMAWTARIVLSQIFIEKVEELGHGHSPACKFVSLCLPQHTHPLSL
jgi:hypothetical protein